MSRYQRAGIDDVVAFYASKFTGGSTAALNLQGTVNSLDIRHAKALWFYEHVRDGSKVLDFGCGGGALAVLKKKGCELIGIELSQEAADAALKAGYDKVLVDRLDRIHGYPAYFDYITSLDVFGHIEPEHKDEALVRLKEMLKPGGTMLHGIEVGDIPYESMGRDELRRYVQVDGHVGLERKDLIRERFERHFRYVDGELRFVHAKPLEDLIREERDYDEGQLGDVVHLLEQYRDTESEVFNTAMGLVFRSMEKNSAPSAAHGGGFMLLRASDSELPPRQQFKTGFTLLNLEEPGSVPLDSPMFTRGWYSVEGSASGCQRWSSPSSWVLFRAGERLETLSLVVALPSESVPMRLAAVPAGQREPVVVHRLETRGPHRVSFPLVRNQGAVSLNFLVDRCSCPAWEGLAQDTRLLGFIVREAHVH